jgi:signal transduction histidine kinase
MRNEGLQLTLKTTLVVLIAAFFVIFMMLMTALQQFLLLSGSYLRRQRAAVADTVLGVAPGIGSRSDSDIARELEGLRRRFGLEYIQLHHQGRTVILGREPQPGPVLRVSRKEGANSTVVVFEPTPLDQLLRTYRTTATTMMAVAAFAAALILFLFVTISRNLASIVGGETEEATTDYVIKTFSTSLNTLKSRTTELTRLHDMARARADELENVTAMLVRSLSSGFMAVDADGNVLDLNAAAREILGVAPPIDPVGRTVTELVGPSEFAGAVASAVDGRSTLQRVEVGHANPEAIVIGLSTIPLLDEEGRYLGMLVLFTDLSPIRRLESRVRDMESLAAIGELSAGIAHEFRNSLSTILGYLRLVRLGVSAAPVAEHVRRAEEECVELSGAVERLLTFARPMALQKQRVELRQLLEEICQRASGVRTDIELRIEGPPVTIDADPTLLARALENLVRNAFESIEQKGGGGSVMVRTVDTPRPGISIADDGAGISPSVRLFLPFQSNKPNGFGLGLALAKKIVLLHHGSIRLVPNQAGGATAEIELFGDETGLARR